MYIRYIGVVDCIRKIFIEEGVKGFYWGCVINLMRIIFVVVIIFISFELILRYFYILFFVKY